MILVPYACAEFHDRAGAVLFTIRPHHLQTLIEAPDSIRQDPLFGMMVHDGTLQVPSSKEERKLLENDPRAKLPEIETAGMKEETAAAAVTAEKASARKGAKTPV